MFPVTTNGRQARTVVEYDVQWSGTLETAARRASRRAAPPVTPRRRPGAIADVVAAAVQEGGLWSIATLAEHTGFSKTDVNGAVYGLEKRGVLARRHPVRGGLILWSWKGGR